MVGFRESDGFKDIAQRNPPSQEQIETIYVNAQFAIRFCEEVQRFEGEKAKENGMFSFSLISSHPISRENNNNNNNWDILFPLQLQFWRYEEKNTILSLQFRPRKIHNFRRSRAPFRHRFHSRFRQMVSRRTYPSVLSHARLHPLAALRGQDRVHAQPAPALG